MAVTDDARNHLFQTLSQQYEPEDARTLIALLSANDIDHLATKDDLDALRTATKADIDGLRAELKGDMDGLRTELKADMDGLRTELKADMDGLRTELKADIGELRGEMRDVLYQQTRTQVTWMFGLLGAYTAMAGSFVAFGTFIIAS
jgi:hypothetical protein